MNFLAHIFLSGENDEVAMGNFIGDFVKGSHLDQYSVGVQKGIRLHRYIDGYTDGHAVVMESKKRLRASYRHYAPVIVDVYYDHFLASLWPDYHSTPLLQFTEKFYRMVDSNLDLMPPRAKNMFTYMKRDNWLYNYQHVEGIRRALAGMSRRTTFDSGMERCTVDLVDNYEEFKAEFRLFFPDLQVSVRLMLEELNRTFQ